MIRFVGCKTAATRDSGNLSSRWRYKTGARLRASMAPLSEAGRPPCTTTGRRGMWARGPHPLDTATISSMPEVRCASLVRTRTTPLRSFISSTVTGQEFPSPVHHVPDRLNAIQRSIRQPRCHTSLFAAGAVAGQRSTSQVRLEPPEAITRNIPLNNCTKLARKNPEFDRPRCTGRWQGYSQTPL